MPCAPTPWIVVNMRGSWIVFNFIHVVFRYSVSHSIGIIGSQGLGAHAMRPYTLNRGEHARIVFSFIHAVFRYSVSHSIGVIGNQDWAHAMRPYTLDRDEHARIVDCL